MEPRAIVFLVEGSIEEALYTTILRRLYNANAVKCETTPRKLRELLDPILNRTRCYRLKNVESLFLFNCGGYDNLKTTIRQLFKRRELIDVAREYEVRVVVAADKDMKPYESVRSILESMGFQVIEAKGMKVKLGEGAEVTIHVIEQGGEGGSSTGEVEDELQKLLENVKPELGNIVNQISGTHGPLTSKQKLLISLALLKPKPKIRSLRGDIEELLNTINDDLLRVGLRNIVEKISEALS